MIWAPEVLPRLNRPNNYNILFTVAAFRLQINFYGDEIMTIECLEVKSCPFICIGHAVGKLHFVFPILPEFSFK